MRTSLAELQNYAHCPILYSRGKGIDKSLPEPLYSISSLMTYVYARQLEIGYKITYDEWINAWNRIWWNDKNLDDPVARQQSNDAIIGLSQLFDYYKTDQRVILAVNLPYRLDIKNHIVCGVVPFVFCAAENSRQITLMEIGEKCSVAQMTRNIELRAMGLMAEQHIGIRPAIMEHLYFDRRWNLQHVCLYPTESFQIASATIILNLLKASKDDIIYPNLHACNNCQLQNTCTI